MGEGRQQAARQFESLKSAVGFEIRRPCSEQCHSKRHSQWLDGRRVQAPVISIWVRAGSWMRSGPSSVDLTWVSEHGLTWPTPQRSGELGAQRVALCQAAGLGSNITARIVSTGWEA